MPEAVPNHKYLEIYNAIRNDILLMVYPDNSPLPTESHLMRKYDASRNTVRRAVKMLQDEGLVRTRQGSGSVVTVFGENLMDQLPIKSPPWPTGTSSIEYHVEPSGMQVSKAALDMVSAPDDVAKAFGIPVGTQIHRIQRMWKMDDKPYLYMIQYINDKILPGFFNHVDEDRIIQNLLEKHWGLHRLYCEEHISCVNAGFIEAGLLSVDVGTALLHTSRLAHCEKGVYELAVFYGNPQYSGYVLRLQ